MSDLHNRSIFLKVFQYKTKKVRVYGARDTVQSLTWRYKYYLGINHGISCHCHLRDLAKLPKSWARPMNSGKNSQSIFDVRQSMPWFWNKSIHEAGGHCIWNAEWDTKSNQMSERLTYIQYIYVDVLCIIISLPLAPKVQMEKLGVENFVDPQHGISYSDFYIASALWYCM